MRMPVPKSVMSTHTARVTSEATAAASHATPNVGSTSLLAKSSASRCKVRGFEPTVFNILSIFAASVFVPENSTSTTTCPSTTTVEANTRSPFFFESRCDSPVSAFSSTSARPETTRPSAAIPCPVWTTKRSPTWSWATGTVSVPPAGRTRSAFSSLRCISVESAERALLAETSSSRSPTPTIQITKAAVTGRPVASAARVAATSRRSMLISPRRSAAMLRPSGRSVFSTIPMAIQEGDADRVRLMKRTEVPARAPPHRIGVGLCHSRAHSAGSLFNSASRISPSPTFSGS